VYDNIYLFTELYYIFNFLVDSEDLYQVSILIDQLKNEDLQVRVSASKSIPRIGNLKSKLITSIDSYLAYILFFYCL